MSGEGGRLQRLDRLRSRRDFQRVGSEGERRSTRHFIVLMAPTRSTETRSRLGITASRRVGNAVVRSRLKRGIREWFRLGRSSLPAGVDVVVIARRGASELSGREVADELGSLFP